MNPDLVRVEAAIDLLSLGIHTVDDQEIEDMARDPAIRSELQEIEAEFSMVEHDGLEDQ